MKRYYALAQQGSEASVTIYGDITSWPWSESDVSSYNLARELAGIEAKTIHVYINSYGGEVSEGLAIYNALKRHPAQVITHCDGFACSVASVVFMAGERRVMGGASLLMIHNAWTDARGNAEELRKRAEDLEIISAAAAQAYRAVVSITDQELDAMLDAEAWIAPEDAVRMGFATEIEEEHTQQPSLSARKLIMEALRRPSTCTDAASIGAAVADALILKLQGPTAEKPPNVAENIPLNFLTALMR